MLTLDGSTLEGGGQLTRMALCLSAITGRAVRIHSIRAGRAARIGVGVELSRGSKHARHSDDNRYDNNDRRGSGGKKGSNHYRNQRDAGVKGHVGGVGHGSRGSAGGLKESHLAALRWLAAQTGADVRGAEVGSTEVVFRPRKRRAGMTRTRTKMSGHRETIGLKNPGSVWLIFQAIYPFMVFASPQIVETDEQKDLGLIDSDERNGGQSEKGLLFDVTLQGGTNVPKSMSTEYVQQVFVPMCELMGLPMVRIETIKQGWTTGPLQVGEVRVRIYSLVSKRKGVNIEPVVETQNKQQAFRPQSKSGSFTASIPPTTTPNFFLRPFNFTTRGAITQIGITILSTPHLFSDLTKNILTEITSHPTFRSLPSEPELKIHSTIDSGHDRRLYILLVAHTSTNLRIGRDFIGSGGVITGSSNNTTSRGSGTRAKSSRTATTRGGEEQMEEKTATEKAIASTLKLSIRKVVNDLMKEIESEDVCVDEFMQDQLVTFQALAEGETRVNGSGFFQRPTGGVDDGDNHNNNNNNNTTITTNLKRDEQVEVGNEEEKEKEEIDGLNLKSEKTKTMTVTTTKDDGGSLHTRTVRWVCEEMLQGLGIEFSPGGKCRGVGWNGLGCILDDIQVDDGIDVEYGDVDVDENDGGGKNDDGFGMQRLDINACVH